MEETKFFQAKQIRKLRNWDIMDLKDTYSAAQLDQKGQDITFFSLKV